MRILIDADGCPVVDIAIACAKSNDVPVVLVCDTAHVFEREGAQTITVSKGADSVDFALVNLIKSGDVVITQDYGLAAMALAKNALVMSQDGMMYTDANIDALLLARHTAHKIRMGGGRLKGSPKRTKEQDEGFQNALSALLNRLQEDANMATQIDSRCGLHCTDCTYKETHHCGGCIETNGHPFHGECPVAMCCQGKGFTQCGQCLDIPCDLLAQYSCDPEHGDTPPGARIAQCKRWANHNR